MDVLIHSFLNQAADECASSLKSRGRFDDWKSALGTDWTEDCVGSSSDLVLSEKKEISCPCRKLNPTASSL
jgi:hypothetical protein